MVICTGVLQAGLWGAALLSLLLTLPKITRLLPLGDLRLGDCLAEVFLFLVATRNRKKNESPGCPSVRDDAWSDVCHAESAVSSSTEL